MLLDSKHNKYKLLKWLNNNLKFIKIFKNNQGSPKDENKKGIINKTIYLKRVLNAVI